MGISVLNGFSNSNIRDALSSLLSFLSCNPFAILTLSIAGRFTVNNELPRSVRNIIRRITTVHAGHPCAATGQQEYLHQKVKIIS